LVVSGKDESGKQLKTEGVCKVAFPYFTEKLLMISEVVLGIDVSKKTLDAALISGNRTHQQAVSEPGGRFPIFSRVACVFRNQTGSRLFGGDRHLRQSGRALFARVRASGVSGQSAAD